MTKTYCAETDGLTSEVIDVLSAMPEPARAYLIDLIGITLGEGHRLFGKGGHLSEIGDDWRSVREALES